MCDNEGLRSNVFLMKPTHQQIDDALPTIFLRSWPRASEKVEAELDCPQLAQTQAFKAHCDSAKKPKANFTIFSEPLPKRLNK